jgi:hypothetical protein
MGKNEINEKDLLFVSEIKNLCDKYNCKFISMDIERRNIEFEDVTPEQEEAITKDLTRIYAQWG